MIRVKAGILALFLAMPAGLSAQAADGGAAMLRPRDAALLGGFVVGGAVLYLYDQQIADWSQRPGIQDPAGLRTAMDVFRTTGAIVPEIATLGMYVGGRLSNDRRLTLLSVHAAESIIVSELMTSTIKGIAGRARPYTGLGPRDFKLLRGMRQGGDYQSFPSGHTTNAFAFASLITADVARWWPKEKWVVGPAAYGIATLVGASRVYHNAHWSSDVAGGALVGTLGGILVSRYNAQHPDNWVERWGLAFPSFPGRSPMLTVSIPVSF
jgi:membrane-associated phospholipid phosphatase